MEPAALAGVLGPDRVVSDPEALAAYSADMTENPAGQAELVVKPRTVEEVQEVVRAAAADGTPLVPAVARMNVGGLTIPERGGIVVDLSEMRRVVELDREHMYAVIEPGVTFGQMRDFLAAEAPELTISYPLAPPYTSVAANFLLDGLGSLSLQHGAHGEQIGGIEAVLASGELVRVGAPAVSPVWFGRAPLPDLTGLFVNWQGSTGIVTKIAVQLQRMPPLTKRMFVFLEGLSFGLVRELVRRELCRDLAGLTWPVGKMVFGVDDPLVRDPGEPQLYVGLEMGAFEKEEMQWRERSLRRVVGEQEGVLGTFAIEDLIAVAPRLARFAEFPMTLDFLLDYPGGGLTWVGTYGPTSKWEEGARRCAALMEAHRVPPLMVTRPMKGGHFGVLRTITLFDRSDPDSVERTRRLNGELLRVLLELGYIPYKAPGWAVREMWKRADPGFVELVRRVKHCLDPQGILNPGRWDLSPG